MMSFIKDSASGIVATVIGNAILWIIAVFSDEARAFLLSKSVNYLISIIILIILISIIINLISRLKHKNKELLQKEEVIKVLIDSTVNYAEKKGFKLYKDFAYYKPDEGVSKLYCKPCLEDRKQERVLQKKGEESYYCSSCKKSVTDTEVLTRLIEKSNEENRKLQNWNGYNGY